MKELRDLGRNAPTGGTTLDRIGAAARKARAAISPWNLLGPADVASFAPGGGLVQAWQDSGRARDNLKAGNYGQAAADYGSMALNTLGELLPVAKLGMALAPLARLPDGRVQLGAVMKDVDRGGLLRLPKSDMRAMNQAVDAQDWTTAEVPIRHLYATQPYANADFADAAKMRGDGADLPLVVRAPDGKMYVRDGHHRLTAEADKGAQTARVRLVDLGEKPAHPELPFSQTPQGITAYHGSPHDFDKFDMSKIGTGEGAQAYGHGLYFAENEGVARGYRDALQHKAPVKVDGVDGGPRYLLQNAIQDARKYPADQRAAKLQEWLDETEAMATGKFAPAGMAENVKEIKRLLASGEVKPDLSDAGKMYQVRINANPDDFLDWDKPLYQQNKISDRVKLAAERALGIDDATGIINSSMGLANAKPLTSNPEFAKALREAGIPGIKYLDAGSRGAGDGTRNYVVFDDKLVSILKKYGWVPGMAIPAAAMMEYQQQGGQAPQM